MLTVGRAIAQHYQREGFLAHFAAVILPTQPDRARERLMGRILEGMVRLAPRRQERAWLVMHRAWDGIDPDERSLAAWTVVSALAELDREERRRLIESESRALARLDDKARARSAHEIARSLSGLGGAGKAVIEEFASVLPADARA